MYTVKDIAKILNFTEHTVRYYGDQGLIPNIQRDANNNRIFNEESVNWLTGIKYLKECGMSLNDIKSYIQLCLEGDSTIKERYNIIQKQYKLAKQQLKESKQKVAYMEKKMGHYEDIINNLIPDDSNPETWDAHIVEEKEKCYQKLTYPTKHKKKSSKIE